MKLPDFKGMFRRETEQERIERTILRNLTSLSTDTLRALKHGLRSFNAKTGKWT